MQCSGCALPPFPDYIMPQETAHACPCPGLGGRPLPHVCFPAFLPHSACVPLGRMPSPLPHKLPPGGGTCLCHLPAVVCCGGGMPLLPLPDPLVPSLILPRPEMIYGPDPCMPQAGRGLLPNPLCVPVPSSPYYSWLFFLFC